MPTFPAKRQGLITISTNGSETTSPPLNYNIIYSIEISFPFSTVLSPKLIFFSKPLAECVDDESLEVFGRQEGARF